MIRPMTLTAAAVSLFAIAGLTRLTVKSARINLLARTAEVASLEARKECCTTARMLGFESRRIKPDRAADIQLRTARACVTRADSGKFTENPAGRLLGQNPNQPHWLHLAAQDLPNPFTCPPPPETTADAADDLSIVYKAHGTVFETLRLYSSSDASRIRMDVDGDLGARGPSILYDHATNQGVYLPPTGAGRSFLVDKSNRLPFLLEYFDEVPLKQIGSDIVAGQRCTKWVYRKRDDKATVCAMDDGILLKISAADRRGATDIIALSVDHKPLPESVFCGLADRTREEAAAPFHSSCSIGSIYARNSTAISRYLKQGTHHADDDNTCKAADGR